MKNYSNYSNWPNYPKQILMPKSKSFKTLLTPIKGLKIHLNKIVGDHRGYFCDLAETDNPLFRDGCTHLHASIAMEKGISRGGHYHYRLKENFYALSGTSLWIFHDFNKKSKTYGKTYSLVLGFSDKKINAKGTKSYFIDKNKLAQIEIPPYIYHAFLPLTKERVVAFVTGTEGYDPLDFNRPSIEDIPRAKKILDKFGIKLT